MSACERFTGQVNEDGSFTILGLVAAPDGTGSAAPDATDGNLIIQADLSSITAYVYDPLSSTPDTALFTTTLTIASVIYNTLQTSGIWGNLSSGGNFRYDAPATWVATGGQCYFINVKFVTTGGNTYWGLWEPFTTKTSGAG